MTQQQALIIEADGDQRMDEMMIAALECYFTRYPEDLDRLLDRIAARRIVGHVVLPPSPWLH